MILNGIKVIHIIAEKFEKETPHRAFGMEGISKEFEQWMSDNKIIHTPNGKDIGEVK